MPEFSKLPQEIKLGKIEELLLEQETPLTIAQKLKLSLPEVEAYTQKIYNDWGKYSPLNFPKETQLNISLKQLDFLIKQAYDSFKKSKRKKKVSKIEVAHDSEKTTDTSTPIPEGNPKFLDFILKVKQQQIKLQGLDKVEKKDDELDEFYKMVELSRNELKDIDEEEDAS